MTDAEIQAVADNEAGETLESHAADCPRCLARVNARRRHVAEFVELTGSTACVPPRLDEAVRRSIAGHGEVRGSTALRETRVQSGRAWAIAVGCAAAVAAVVFLVLPHVGSPTRLSAAEVLGRSLQTLSAARGVEQLEYDLIIDGALQGKHRVVQVIDHDQPNRFMLAKYGLDGRVEAAVSQDPVTGRRAHAIRVDGRRFVINVTDSHLLPSVPEMVQAQLEALVTMMRTTSNPTLSIADGPSGRKYIIEVPPTPASSIGGGLLDLDRARIVINDGDFVIQELEASGTVLRQPFSGSFKLIRHTIRPSADVPADTFTIAPAQDDVVLEAEGAGDPLSDVLIAALREVGRTKAR